MKEFDILSKLEKNWGKNMCFNKWKSQIASGIVVRSNNVRYVFMKRCKQKQKHLERKKGIMPLTWKEETKVDASILKLELESKSSTLQYKIISFFYFSMSIKISPIYENIITIFLYFSHFYMSLIFCYLCSNKNKHSQIKLFLFWTVESMKPKHILLFL